jgi:cytochrome d ubiquinol oxidase subunit I
VKGLDTVPASDRPNVQLLFQTWHLMVGIGIMLALIMVVGVFLWYRKRLEYSFGYLRVLKYSMPLPIIACILGWITTESGRQPWIVQGVLRTSDAVSVTVPAGQVAATLGVYAAIYTFLAIAWFLVVRGIIRKGPEVIVAPSAAEGERLAVERSREKLLVQLGATGKEYLKEIAASRKKRDQDGDN